MANIFHVLFAKVYIILTSTRIRRVVRCIDNAMRVMLGKHYDHTVLRLKYKIANETIKGGMNVSEEKFRDICWQYEEERCDEYRPLISVIVPNYNHAPYLRERLDSIYGQTYTNIEVILLDDWIAVAYALI